jgi:murein DD-endopeptidase MepM/ murein hydrolase activator NlpD
VVRTVEKQRGLGRLVKIDHGGNVMTVYAHLHEARVARGDRVARGQVVALSGNSGRSTAPHLHYEVRLGGRTVNPLTYILDTYADRP